VSCAQPRGRWDSRGPRQVAARRRSGFNVSYALETATSDRAVFEADRAWVRDFWSAMRPHASGAGGYVNFMSEVDENRVRVSYGEAK
jgi:hypothetical protein